MAYHLVGSQIAHLVKTRVKHTFMTGMPAL